LIALRKEHPRWGARKLLGLLAHRQPNWELPRASSVCNILRADGVLVAGQREIQNRNHKNRFQAFFEGAS
jgi:hypothetical protein